MLSRKNIAPSLLTSSLLILVACGAEEPGVPVTGETASADPTPVSPGLPPEAVLNAQNWLAAQLNVPPAQVQITDMEQAEWPDSCLGLGKANESCAAVITPGWSIVFEVNGQTYEARTDETGANVRLANSQGSPVSETGLENTQWNLVSLGAPGSETPLVEGSSVTLLLAAGQAGGSGGCNGYGGRYQVAGNNISFSEITSTLRACEDMQLTEQERRYLGALQTATQFEVQGDQLRITYDGGSGSLIFESASLSGPAPTETPEG